MKTILLTVSDDAADALLRRHGGQHVDPKTGEVLQDTPPPEVRVDLRADAPVHVHVRKEG